MAEEKSKKIHKVKVVHHDGPIMLPEKLSAVEAIEVLKMQVEYEAQDVRIQEMIPVFVWDGALALAQALEEQFGYAMQQAEKSWFGDIPPTMISVACGVGKTVSIPWGNFSIPGVKGKCSTGYTHHEGRLVFQFVAVVKRAHERQIKKLVERTREIALGQSIYRGQAISIEFFDREGEPHMIPVVNFLELKEAPPIFSRDLESAIDANILTPIRYSQSARDAGVPLKRGALLAGRYGTGKTLTANQIAQVSSVHGWTFIYVPKVEELAQALSFAGGFQPAVVFAEDVDRIAGSVRDEDVNKLLNTLDGIGSKSAEIMVILTSNYPEKINPAMRRPGRIDLVLEVCPPDAEAAQRLMFHYGHGLILPGEDLQRSGEIMAGQIPAVIREVVERAKLEMLKRTQGELSDLTDSDLASAARVLVNEQKLFAPAEHKGHHLDGFGVWMEDRVKTSVQAHVPALVKKALNGDD